ncbi:LTA synthase family protein [Oceanimonas sp. CAM02]|uniref:LTA synthase family protein n=1 Tax=Oceanimonas sp. CAM02 TaxID=3080336 RepID=UPI0029358FAC|nr:LTA synthase family protein [Oceanimonas sp. CAM02]MDV2857532.1 LTA synthase family protein [Oceanimonas sp. CAM02]
MNKFKQRLGTLWPFFGFVVLNLGLLSGSRLGLALWQAERVSDAGGWGPVLLQGLRVDVSALCWLFGVPAVLTLLLAGRQGPGRAWMGLMRLWLTMGTGLLVLLELATPAFINTYDLRPNRLFIEYLIYPKEVFGMLWQGHLPAVLLAAVLMPAALWGLWRWSGRLCRELTMPAWYWRPVLALLVLALGLLGGRSTLGHRGLNPALVAFSTDPLVNGLALNSAYSVGFALRQLGKEESASSLYGRMEQGELLATLHQAQGRPEQDYVSAALPSLTHNTSSYRGKPKNLVIILEESLGAQFVGALGGLPLTPEFDKLARQGWLFEQLYATGTRSVRGIEAVVTGFTPTPARAVVKLDKSQTGFFTLAQLLRERGYHTQFIYGGESHFDNMASFFLGNGFEHIVDQRDFESPAFEGSWGVSDEDLFARAHQEFERLHDKGNPFFSLVFSSSNHDPFEFPDDRIELYEQPRATRNNAAKYADYALGRFFEQAQQSDYWQDTLFLVVADHDSRTYGPELVPVPHFRVPALLLGEDIAPRRDGRLVSQIDLPPTLLSLAGIDSDNPMLGRDLTRYSPNRALMQFDQNFALLKGEDMVVLQPEQDALGFQYDSGQQALTPAPLDTELAQQAKAYALWGSLAYQNGLYRLPDESANVALNEESSDETR